MRLWRFLAFLNVLLIGVPMLAQQQYLLTSSSPTTAQSICSRHGLTFQATAWSSYAAGKGVYLVSAPAGSSDAAVETDLSTDSSVFGVEPVHPVSIPELAGASLVTLTQSTSPILEAFSTTTATSFFGSSVPNIYINQIATQLIRVSSGRQVSGLTGSGITVAIIDTGIDPNHPVFSSVLVPGFDFTRGVAGSASELADLSPSVSLSQSTNPILEGLQIVPMNGFSAAILDQSTSPILEGNVPQAFGHGTMIAGLVHVIAPDARIMPLKAFRSDGSSDTFNIVRAIYWATEHGAQVISMSFEITQSSPALQAAINYAQNKGVISVAAAGNDNWQTAVFPAGFSNVIGVGSTNLSDVKSAFSNFGSADVKFAAPGEALITAYPGGFYAVGWGTSFSAPLLSGSVALVLQHNFQAGRCGFSDLINPLSRTVQVPQMGYGRVDLYKALTNLSGGDSGGGCGYSTTTSKTTDD